MFYVPLLVYHYSGFILFFQGTQANGRFKGIVWGPLEAPFTVHFFQSLAKKTFFPLDVRIGEHPRLVKVPTVGKPHLVKVPNLVTTFDTSTTFGNHI